MKKLLVVVDYQNDFVNGSLGFPGAEALEETICEKIRAYQKAGNDVVCTLDTHGEDYSETQEGHKLPIPHCLRGTQGWELYGKTAELLKDCRKFEKPVFGSAGLFEFLRETPYSSIELCGLVSNICVISNAVLARTAQPEAEIVVDAACTASNDPALNEAVLRVLEGLQVTVLHHGS
ncbi:cysteine hydrolase family protein [Anaeromassilibacillus sp. An200]|uniref:Cysteine hydrolase n=1 Tax=Candidatus Caccousia stercoris TaxID=2840723 RepID=A0A9D1FSW2_9FIRM|nr:isochorismatase family cysteine hydrolase [Anaeromassilibacillus sp. An200]OUP13011.1 N-carbamoylsarcosine amidohydrolase [Anaeromassilibacillus sp. An200]HIS79426.1 cysteine hydrolase [Candidatus Caccousia stercoris]